MIFLFQEQLSDLTENFLGYKAEDINPETLQKELIEAQIKVQELIKTLAKAEKLQNFELKAEPIRDLQKTYPWLNTLEYKDSSKTLELGVRRMPLNLEMASTFEATEYDGCIYSTFPMYPFTIKIKHHTSSPPYAFTSQFMSSKHNLYFDKKKETYYNYKVLKNSYSRCSHPHTNQQVSTFASVCYGTNPFNTIFNNQIEHVDQFYTGLRYILKWLCTYNVEDAYHSNICPEFVKTNQVVDNTFFRAVAEVFVKVNQEIKEQDSPYEFASTELRAALASILYDECLESKVLEDLLPGSFHPEGHYLIIIQQVLYKLLILCDLSLHSNKTKPFSRYDNIRDIIIIDLVYFTTRAHNQNDFLPEAQDVIKVANTPYMLRKYQELRGHHTELTQYLPSEYMDLNVNL